MRRHLFDEIQSIVERETRKLRGPVGSLNETGLSTGPLTASASLPDSEAGPQPQSWYHLSASVPSSASLSEFVDAYTVERSGYEVVAATDGVVRIQQPGSGRASLTLSQVRLSGSTPLTVTVNAPGAQISLFVNRARVASGQGALETTRTLPAGAVEVAILLHGGSGQATIQLPSHVNAVAAETTPAAPFFQDAAELRFLDGARGQLAVSLNWLNDPFVASWQVYRNDAQVVGFIDFFDGDADTATIRLVGEPAPSLVTGSSLYTKFFRLGRVLSVEEVGGDTELVVDMDPAAAGHANWLNQPVFLEGRYESLARVTYAEASDEITVEDSSVRADRLYLYRVTAFSFITMATESVLSAAVQAFTNDGTAPAGVTLVRAADFVRSQVHVAFRTPDDDDFAGVRVYGPYADGEPVVFGPAKLITTLLCPRSSTVQTSFAVLGVGSYYLAAFDAFGNEIAFDPALVDEEAGIPHIIFTGAVIESGASLSVTPGATSGTSLEVSWVAQADTVHVKTAGAAVTYDGTTYPPGSTIPVAAAGSLSAGRPASGQAPGLLTIEASRDGARIPDTITVPAQGGSGGGGGTALEVQAAGGAPFVAELIEFPAGTLSPDGTKAVVDLSNYLTRADADSTYVKPADLDDFITESDADARYLQQGALAGYLTEASGDSRYLQLSGGSLAGPLGVVPGTAAEPGLFFAGDAETGLYQGAAGALDVAAGGAAALRIDRFAGKGRLRFWDGTGFGVSLRAGDTNELVTDGDLSAAVLETRATTGTSPLRVASRTLVTNLTAHYLGADGQNAAYFRNASNLATGWVAVHLGGTGRTERPLENQILVGNVDRGYSLVDIAAGPGINLDFNLNGGFGTLTISAPGGGGGSGGSLSVEADGGTAVTATALRFAAGTLTEEAPGVARVNFDGRYLALAGGTLTGALVLTDTLDARGPIRNTGGLFAGRVYIDDDMEVTGDLYAAGSLRLAQGQAVLWAEHGGGLHMADAEFVSTVGGKGLSAPTLRGDSLLLSAGSTTAGEWSAPAAAGGGYDAVLKVRPSTGSPPITTLAVRANGDAWLRGEMTAMKFFTGSAAALKTDIRDFDTDALGLLEAIRVVRFRYRADARGQERVGFIADETDSLFAGDNHDQFDIPNTVGVLIAAVQRITEENSSLRRRVAQLEDER
jgi:hypothetical protein